MLLKRLIFDNYKTYYGHQEIDLYIPEEVRTKQQKNIVLIGGLNGAGKTTILKAILYTLFGKRGVSEIEYKKLFSNVINNLFFDEGGRDCSITLTLETDAKEEWELKVFWSFDNFKRLLHENREITIKKPGTVHGRHVKIQNIEAYNRFIDKIIPYHAAPFFIFDGEEIKDVILRQNSDEMKEAIHKITGMESQKNFLIDLNNIKKDLQHQIAKQSDNKKLHSIQQSIEEQEKNIEILEKKLNNHSSTKKELEAQIIFLKEERDRKLLHNRNSRDKLISEQSNLNAQQSFLTNKFNESFSKNATFIILENKIRKLVERIQLEKKVRDQRTILESTLIPYKKFIDDLLNQDIKPPLSIDQLEQIKEIGRNIWLKDQDISSNSINDIEEIHDLSPKEFNFLGSIKISTSNQFVEILNQLEKIAQQTSNLEQKILNAPDAIDVTEETSKLNELHKKIGEIEIKERSLRVKLKRTKEERQRLTTQFNKISVQTIDLGNIEKRYEIIENLIATMTEFIDRSTKMKANFIRDEFQDILTKLFRKQNEFGKIDFDVDTYTIRLFNDREQEISIQDRSAGEMQMISSSLIWALTKASDLELPMVIDTPLGRLDSVHRRHLIEFYYKHLGNQVIILSTDTEISDEYIKLMSDNSYRQYMLDYNENKKYTIVRDGYFNFVRA